MIVFLSSPPVAIHILRDISVCKSYATNYIIYYGFLPNNFHLLSSV